MEGLGRRNGGAVGRKMWIIPKSIMSAYAPDMEASISDCVELSEICARSLTVRSKHSSSRTWSQKWKRDSWTRLLYGRICRPSHSESFEDWWISSLGVIPANRGLPPENERGKTIQDTSGLGSPTESDIANQDCVSSRMLKVMCRWDSPQSSATWKKWVMRCRGEYSARQKSAPPTSESGYSYSGLEKGGWPTPRSQDSKHGFCTKYELERDRGKDLLHVRVEREKMWPTASARDWKDSSGMSMTGTNPDGSERKRTDQLARAVFFNGRQGQDNGNSNGSRQEPSERLNPRWVETLMGLPVGWVMPSCKFPATTEPTS